MICERTSALSFPVVAVEIDLAETLHPTTLNFLLMAGLEMSRESGEQAIISHWEGRGKKSNARKSKFRMLTKVNPFSTRNLL